mmetsp:Transcript_29601/g.60506  ORF Transcript_29601/g.60506 Transcript_29601/m.60506 type:complete len:219 (+) Transcript_29601:37-693(+)
MGGGPVDQSDDWVIISESKSDIVPSRNISSKDRSQSSSLGWSRTHFATIAFILFSVVSFGSVIAFRKSKFSGDTSLLVVVSPADSVGNNGEDTDTLTAATATTAVRVALLECTYDGETSTEDILDHGWVRRIGEFLNGTLHETPHVAALSSALGFAGFVIGVPYVPGITDNLIVGGIGLVAPFLRGHKVEHAALSFWAAATKATGKPSNLDWANATIG